MPTPRRTATSAPMPFAQNPSILRSSSAFAAVSAEIDVAPGRARHRRDRHAVARGVDAGRDQQPPQPHLDPGRRADAAALDDAEIAALWRRDRRA